MNRATCRVSALRVSIPDADVPSARACRRHSSPSSLVAPRRSGHPNATVDRLRPCTFLRKAAWSLALGGCVGSLGRRSAQLCTHTGTPVRIIPPGGHPPKCVVNPARFARGSEVYVVLAMLDVLASALRSPDGRSPLVQLRASCAWLRAPPLR